MRCLSLLALVTPALACGRSWLDPVEVSGGASTGPGPGDGGTSSSTSGRLDVDDGVLDEAEADDGSTVDGTSDDGDPTGERTCTAGPDVRWLRFYDGAAARTVAGDLERGPDGTLYMGGTRADDDDMELWIAAAAPDGTILWERTALPDPSDNLAGWLSIAEDLLLVGDLLLFAGGAYGEGPVAWHGFITLDGDFLAAEERVDAVWYGAALADDGSLYLAGRNDAPDGSLLVRSDGDVLWSASSPERSIFSEVDSGVVVHASGDAFVAGRRSEQAWIARIDAASGQPTWARSVLDTATVPAESGGFWAIAQAGDSIVAGGDVRVHKDTDPGSVIYNEIYVAAWSPEGEPRWSWQRGIDELMPGRIEAITAGPDGTIYVTGEEADFDGDDVFFAAAFSPSGRLLGTIDHLSHRDEPDLVGLRGVGLAVGDDGQVFVLAGRRWLSEETTALLELCFF